MLCFQTNQITRVVLLRPYQTHHSLGCRYPSSSSSKKSGRDTVPSLWVSSATRSPPPKNQQRSKQTATDRLNSLTPSLESNKKHQNREAPSEPHESNNPSSSPLGHVATTAPTRPGTGRAATSATAPAATADGCLAARRPHVVANGGGGEPRGPPPGRTAGPTRDAGGPAVGHPSPAAAAAASPAAAAGDAPVPLRLLRPRPAVPAPPDEPVRNVQPVHGRPPPGLRGPPVRRRRRRRPR
jgi:hypothetical protein